MRSLSVSSARSTLPTLLDDVFIKHETIIISRKGKPVAQLAPLPSGSIQDETSCFPLRGITISISQDFDEPAADLWEALGR